MVYKMVYTIFSLCHLSITHKSVQRFMHSPCPVIGQYSPENSNTYHQIHLRLHNQAKSQARGNLQVAVLANRNGDIWFLLVKSRPVHCDARLVRLPVNVKFHFSVLGTYPESRFSPHHHLCFGYYEEDLEDVLDAHGGHLDHHKVDVPVRQLLRRLREQQRPSGTITF